MADTVRELIRLSHQFLQEKGVDSPRLDAELLLAHALDCQRIDLYVRFDEPLLSEQVDRYRELIRARAARAPCAYLTGKREFYAREMCVDRRVLIPRPETETLVDVLLDADREGRVPEGPGLDLGTGSGAIAVTVACQLPARRLVATDISVDALQVARLNRDAHDVRARIALVAARGFEGLCGRFAFILSNPPYIPCGDRETIMPEVVNYEPEAALFAGEDGLDVLRDIFVQAPDHLLAGGLLAVECDPRQTGALLEMGRRFGDASTVRDLAGRERVVRVFKT